MDRISNLPDEIIHRIGSFLSAKEAAFTKVLSTRWRNLLTIISDLRYDVLVDGESSLKGFVDGVVAFPVHFRVRNISLRWSSVQSDHINRCLRHVVKHGLLNLGLQVTGEEGITSVPFEVFMCKTVATLTLGSGFVVGIIPKNIFFPGLKFLVLDSVRFYSLSGCAFESLLSACPVLEELVIYGLNWELWKWSGIVSSLSLKRLTILRTNWKMEEVNHEPTISFDTPNLLYFEYTDFAPCVYSIVNLSSVVGASLYFPVFQDPTNIIKGLENVEILSLGSPDQRISWPGMENTVFEKLFQLSVKSKPDHCWIDLPEMLKRSPNLKSLTMEGLHYNPYEIEKFESVCDCLSGYSFLQFCSVEVLKITKFKGEIGEMVQIKHVLEKMQSLELMEVYVQEAREDSKKLEIMTNLLMLPKASSKCKVEVKFF